MDREDKKINDFIKEYRVFLSNNQQEYDFAKNFLKEITDGLGIDEKNIYCVPGNHD